MDRVSELQLQLEEAAGAGESGCDKHFRMAVGEALRRLQQPPDAVAAEEGGSEGAYEDGGGGGGVTGLGAEPFCSAGSLSPWEGDYFAGDFFEAGGLGNSIAGGLGSDEDLARTWELWETSDQGTRRPAWTHPRSPRF